MTLCICNSGLEAADCCAPIHAGKPATTALALMRSRYAAFATGNMECLAKTCTPELRKNFRSSDADRNIQWLGLEIKRTVAGGPEDETGQVEFTYRYALNGREFSQTELSDFVRSDGAWLYAGAAKAEEKAGRNDPCPCGSGRKYKKCCGA